MVVVERTFLQNPGEFLILDDYYFYSYATTLTIYFYICYFWLFKDDVVFRVGPGPHHMVRYDFKAGVFGFFFLILVVFGFLLLLLLLLLLVLLVVVGKSGLSNGLMALELTL